MVCSAESCSREAIYAGIGMCRKHRDRVYYGDKKRNRSAEMRAYRANNKQIVFNHYGNFCACCGENNFLFLSVDHVNNDGHADIWPSGARKTGEGLYLKIISMNFPKDYQILCMNCNWGKRINNGICPHKVLVV